MRSKHDARAHDVPGFEFVTYATAHGTGDPFMAGRGFRHLLASAEQRVGSGTAVRQLT